MKNLMAAIIVIVLVGGIFFVGIAQKLAQQSEEITNNAPGNQFFIECPKKELVQGLGICKDISGRLVWVLVSDQTKPYLLAHAVVSPTSVPTIVPTPTMVITTTGKSGQTDSGSGGSGSASADTSYGLGVLVFILMFVAIILVLVGPGFYNYFIRKQHVESVNRVGPFKVKVGMDPMSRAAAGFEKVSASMLNPYLNTLGGELSPSQTTGFKIGARSAWIKAFIMLAVVLFVMHALGIGISIPTATPIP